ncbi:MAG: 4Fe-4S dicluster domain-containing protein [bacterium]
MVEVRLDFKGKLDSAIGGEMHSFCFQCGACVGDCPAARYSSRGFNPRLIVLETILGLEDSLLQEGSIIWECTNCYNCYERCPQDVRPVEVITALKNMSAQRETNPEDVRSMVKSVETKGMTTVITALVDKRRKELGLESLGEVPVSEIQELLVGQ